jgi:hypothetical protein
MQGPCPSWVTTLIESRRRALEVWVRGWEPSSHNDRERQPRRSAVFGRLQPLQQRCPDALLALLARVATVLPLDSDTWPKLLPLVQSAASKLRGLEAAARLALICEEVCAMQGHPPWGEGSVVRHDRRISDSLQALEATLVPRLDVDDAEDTVASTERGGRDESKASIPVVSPDERRTGTVLSWSPMTSEGCIADHDPSVGRVLVRLRPDERTNLWQGQLVRYFVVNTATRRRHGSGADRPHWEARFVLDGHDNVLPQIADEDVDEHGRRL